MSAENPLAKKVLMGFHEPNWQHYPCAGASLFLRLLLGADLVYILLCIGIFDLDPKSCDVSGICAYMNAYHLVKLFWIVILLVHILRSTKYYRYSAWILAFTFFLIDDALLLHQKAGARLAAVSGIGMIPTGELQPHFLGLAVLAIAGFILLAIVAWTCLRGSRTFRRVSQDLLLFLAALTFFGLIVDVAESLHFAKVFIVGLGFVEDGGELVVYSLIVWYVFILATRETGPDLFLKDFLVHHRST